MSLILNGTTGLSDVDGTAAAPAISGTDTNTGLFFGADIIGFAEGGVECARFNADSQFVAAAGTAALPVITTTGDVNTGIFFPAADRIGFAEGGVQVGEFDASSNFLFNSGYGSVAVAYGCRAWVNFNGSGTIAIRASGNVSSLTDVGAGDYRVNFTNAMPDANYSAVITSGQKAVVWGIVLFSTSNPFLTTSVGLVTQTPSDSPNDNPYVCVSIFR